MAKTDKPADQAERMRVINARLPEDLRAALDEYTKNHAVDRSSVVRKGVALAIGQPDLCSGGDE